MTSSSRRFRSAALALALIPFCSTISWASPVWVFLRDKGIAGEDQLSAQISASRSALSPAALERRAARGTADVTMSDLPVSTNYVNQISAAGASLRVQSKWLNAVSIDATPAELARISSLPFVDHLQPVIGVAREQMTNNVHGEGAGQPIESTNDFYGASSVQLNQINIPAVHALGYTGQGMRIGILDSGFKRTHAAFNQPGHVISVLAEHDFIEGDTSTAETTDNQHQHGTWVLGCIGAYQPNVLVGGAYDASFLLAKTEVVPTETQVEEDYWVEGLEYLESNGADIVTSSLGYIDWYTQSQLDGHTAVTTIAALAAAQRGLVITNAAGNEGHDSNPTTSHLIAPADADLLITVGAVDSSGVAAGFSSDGPTADLRVKPELMARGVQAATVRTSSDTGTTNVDGTSFATPLTAAAITLVIQAHPDWTVEQLRYVLFNTASRNGVFDPLYVNGYGIINTLAAVQYSLDKYYTNPASGPFATASNWTSTGVPISVNNVFITPTNSLSVTGPTAATRIHRLTLGATGAGQLATLNLNGGANFTIDSRLDINAGGRLDLTSGSLAVRGTTTNNNLLNLGANATLAEVIGTGTLNANAGANVSATSITQFGVTVGGQLTIAQSALPTTSRVNLLAVAGGLTPTGKLDLKNNALVIDYAASPVAIISAQIAYAFNGGAWDRAGITSSLADGAHGVGYAEASALASVPAIFGNVDSTSLLLRYTILGDADLNGRVDFSDLLKLAQNYESNGAYWYQGDFTYDSSVDFGDLLVLAQHYGSSLLSAGQLQSLAEVGGSGFARDWTLAQGLAPEPGIFALVVLPALSRTRRRMETAGSTRGR